MRRIGPLLAVAMGALLAAAFTACEAAPPSAAPTPTATSVAVKPPGPPQALACIDVNAVECNQVSRLLQGMLPGERGDPFAVQVWLMPCLANVDAPCPKSLAARQGPATVEYADEGPPLVYHVAGQPLDPSVDLQVVGPWSDPIQPGSPQADGPGPYDFEVGHCGILHVVDFDGSFWVLVGQVDGEEPALLNADTGSIQLLTQERARYVSSNGATFELARFPGARRFQLCD